MVVVVRHDGALKERKREREKENKERETVHNILFIVIP